MIVIWILLGIGSTAALVCLAVFVLLAHRQDSLTLHKALYSYSEGQSLRQKAFLILGSSAMFVCMFQGTAAMLSWTRWIPESWGFTSAVIGISATFALLCGGMLLSLLKDAPRNATLVPQLQERAKCLEQLLSASLDERLLREIEEELHKTQTALVSELTQEGDPAGLRRGPDNPPKHWRVQQYDRLIWLTEKQRERLCEAKPDRMGW